jgi:hypothetical protein
MIMIPSLGMNAFPGFSEAYRNQMQNKDILYSS